MTAVAIVIPTLNRAPLLRDAIASGLRCEPAPNELVVVDCGSTDDTRAVVRSFGDDVELVERPLPNAASARNIGLESTCSPYVSFLDSDDEALPGKTGGLAAVLDVSPDAGLVHGAMEIMTEEGEPLPRETARNAEDRAKGRKTGTSYPDLASFCSMFTSATLIRRSAVEEIGGYDESLDAYEDWDLYLRMSLVARLVYEEVPAARYRVWSGNVPWDRTARGVVEVARKHLAMLDEVPPDQRRVSDAAFRRRLAGSLYTLAELREARREALAAFWLGPREAIASPEARRALVRSFLPASSLERRRPPRSSSLSQPHEAWPERIDPLHEPPGVVAHHLKKYEFASQRVRGLVIDVACGVGYGTAYLAPATERIVGVEIADEAIAIARERYQAESTWFVQADAEQLPFGDGVADAVTCFEGIEHFREPEVHLGEVVRVLRPDAVYIVSTPHPDANPHGEENPYHLHEFEPEAFETMLRDRFADVTMLGQRRLQTSVHRAAQRLDVLGLRRSRLLRPLLKRISRSALRTAPVDEATVADFVIEPFQSAALEYVALCREPISG